jgi:hypothetical protein
VATALPVVEPRIQCHYFPDTPRTYDRVVPFVHRERWVVFIQCQDAMKTFVLVDTHYVLTIHSLNTLVYLL